MQDISFVSESYSKRKPKDCRLSISIREDGFSFLIVHKREILAYSYVRAPKQTIEESFKNFLAQDILRQTFQAVSVIIVTPSFTFVPKKFYDDSMLQSYVSLNFPENERDSFITYESIETDVVVLFPIPLKLWGLCRTAFKAQDVVSYVPQVAPLLELHCKERKDKLVISVENSFFSALYVKSKEVRFCNAFSFSTVNDFTYYIMNIYEQLHLNPLETPLELSGKISAGSPYFKALQVFIKHVSMVDASDYPATFPLTLFYNHCHIALCE